MNPILLPMLFHRRDRSYYSVDEDYYTLLINDLAKTCAIYRINAWIETNAERFDTKQLIEALNRFEDRVLNRIGQRARNVRIMHISKEEQGEVLSGVAAIVEEIAQASGIVRTSVETYTCCFRRRVALYGSILSAEAIIDLDDIDDETKQKQLKVPRPTLAIPPLP